MEFKVISIEKGADHTLITLKRAVVETSQNVSNLFIRMTDLEATGFPIGKKFLLLPSGFGFKYADETQIESSSRIADESLERAK